MNNGIGERLRILRDSLAIKNQTKFAEILGITQTSLSKYENEAVEIPDSVKIKISELNVNLHWLLTGKGEMILQKQKKSFIGSHELRDKQIPIYNESDLPEGSFIIPLLDQRLSAGDGSYVPEEDKIKGLIYAPAYISSYGNNIAALTVEGDSMYPTLSRGDIVVCDSFGWSGEGVYALRIGGEGFVKRLSKGPGKIIIISDNPQYPTLEEPEESQDIQIIGRVHCALKRI